MLKKNIQPTKKKHTKNQRRDPVPCAFLMMVRFRFFGGFSIFGKILQNFVGKQQKRVAHCNMHSIWQFCCPSLSRSLSLLLLIAFISIVFSQFIFCIFYNHVTMVIHFVCFMLYFVCVYVCMCAMCMIFVYIFFLYAIRRFQLLLFCHFSVDNFPSMPYFFFSLLAFRFCRTDSIACIFLCMTKVLR